MVTLINIRALDIRATLAALIMVLCLVPVSLFASEDKFIEGLSAYFSGNYDKAADIWHPLAQQGHAKAQYQLGKMYDFAEGIPQDDAEAVKWYRRAAEQGHATAQVLLAIMYYQGRGVLQDYAEAAKWYRRAAEQGNDGAQLFLGMMYQEGHGVPQDYAKAVIWYRRAAEQGKAGAQNNIGYMYNNGYSVPQNYVLAHMWYNLAASQGYEMSLGSGDGEPGNRDLVARQMTPAQIARAQGLATRCLVSDYQDCGE